MTEPAERPTAKKNVTQAVIVLGLIVAALVVLLTAFRNTAPITTGSSNSPQPAQLPNTRPEQFSEAAAELARLSPESQQANPRSRNRDDTFRASASDPEALLRALTTLGSEPRGAPPTPHAGPSVPSTPADEDRRQRLQARMAPLKGAIEAPRADVIARTLGGENSRADSASSESLTAGTVLFATLDNAVSSDYPGAPWVATISRPARLKNGRVAIPSGSKVVGTTGRDDGPNQILQGRLVLSALKIVTPDGSELSLDARALDAAGIGAVPGPTDRHVLAQAGGVLAYALIGAATVGSTSSEPLSTRSELEGNAVQGAGQQVAPLANRYLSVQPTVVAQPGTALRFVLTDSLAVSGGTS